MHVTPAISRALISGCTYGDFEVLVVEEESSVGAAELVTLGLGEGGYVNTCHFSI
jgi:hypothetical protein